jgi:hypothetical protein
MNPSSVVEDYRVMASILMSGAQFARPMTQARKNYPSGRLMMQITAGHADGNHEVWLRYFVSMALRIN